MKLLSLLKRLSKESPFRLFTMAFVKALPVSIRTKAYWDAAPRPQYLAGVLAAADEAIREGVKEISVFEFGVGSGSGLLALADSAAAVEAETGVRVAVYGFDSGTGLPESSGDYRDHPDHWRAGDYPMDEVRLRRRLSPGTRLVIGDIRDRLPQTLPRIHEPVGFISVDVDLYSSAREVLRMLAAADRNMLRRVFMYFDDVDLRWSHRFAGELLAIEEFNSSSAAVKIDRWRDVAKNRPFPEAPWLGRMYIAHDLEAISGVRLRRAPKSYRLRHERLRPTG